MKTIPSSALVGMISMYLLAGCSVKEDRELCPCRLMLDFREVDTSVIRYADLFVEAGDGAVFTMRLEPEDLREVLAVDVRKGEINLGIWNGTDMMEDGGGVKIPYGDDCPPVYFHTSSMSADEDYVHEVVRMRKNHCVMTLDMDWGGTEIEEVAIIGNVDGYSADGSPAEGGFSYEPEIRDDCNCQVVLPRQIDDSLVLEVSDSSGILKRFALGEYIAASGYDWSEPDLKDITIEMDLAVLRISVTVQGWDATHRFDVVI